jgi:hypothetical protein
VHAQNLTSAPVATRMHSANERCVLHLVRHTTDLILHVLAEVRFIVQSQLTPHPRPLTNLFAINWPF